MGKKPVTKAKAKSAGYAEPEKEEAPKTAAQVAEEAERRKIFTQRREAGKWATAQFTVARDQFEEAKVKCGIGGDDWLQLSHEFHEKKLIKLSKRLEAKTLDSIPQALKDGVEAYLTQAAGKNGDVEKEGFKDHRDDWDLLPPEEGEGFARAADSPEAVEAIKLVKVWAETDVKGIEKLGSIMNTHAVSGGMQEAGLARLGMLFKEALAGTASPGLTAEIVMPIISAGMPKHLADLEVQRAGLASLRGLAMQPGLLSPLCTLGGVKLGVEALRKHFASKELVLSATAAFWEMAKIAGKNTPEISGMRTDGVPDILMKAMTHHSWDQTLAGKIRVVLPFLGEDRI